jgi:hypothetical protein
LERRRKKVEKGSQGPIESNNKKRIVIPPAVVFRFFFPGPIYLKKKKTFTVDLKMICFREK